MRLYEIGRTYLFGGEDGLAIEKRYLTLGAYGESMDFFEMKGAIEGLLAGLRAEDIRFEAVKDNPSYHPGRCASVWAGGEYVGVFGQIHPLTAKNYDVDAELYCAELSMDALRAAQGAPAVYKPLPKFPAVTRDLALVCEEGVTVGQLESCIRAAAKALLKEIRLFDVYRGPGVAEGKKSAAFSLVLRADDRSLTAEEADACIAEILKALSEKLQAVLR